MLYLLTRSINPCIGRNRFHYRWIHLDGGTVDFLLLLHQSLLLLPLRHLNSPKANFNRGNVYFIH